MIGMQQEPGRPLAQFYLEPVEQRGKGKGRAIYVDAEFVRITVPGGNTVIEREATETDKERFEPEYKAFKKGDETPTVGTPLKLWPAATPGFVKTAAGLGILSVEQLATISDTLLQKLGPGARNWKDKASAFIQAAEDRGVLAEEVADLKTAIQDLRDELERTKTQNEILRAQVTDK